jgi:hypothetical protein
MFPRVHGVRAARAPGARTAFRKIHVYRAEIAALRLRRECHCESPSRYAAGRQKKPGSLLWWHGQASWLADSFDRVFGWGGTCPNAHGQRSLPRDKSPGKDLGPCHQRLECRKKRPRRGISRIFLRSVPLYAPPVLWDSDIDGPAPRTGVTTGSGSLPARYCMWYVRLWGVGPGPEGAAKGTPHTVPICVTTYRTQRRVVFRDIREWTSKS